MTGQTTVAAPIRVRGTGLHTGRTGVVTLRPAPAGHGRRLCVAGCAESVPMTAAHWQHSRMSTAIALPDGRSVRTIEHLMAALSAHAVDNVLVEVAGPEIPILDGSAWGWSQRLRAVGLVPLPAPRRAIRILAPIQVERDGGFLRAEPGDGFVLDVTHDVLPAFPVMAWRGPVDAATFDGALARSRSFGNLHRRLGLSETVRARPASHPAVMPNRPDPDVPPSEAQWTWMASREGDPHAPLLRGWRPWRATVVLDGRVLPWPRFADEPVRHVALDMIGDLALAGAPLIGRVVAHNPSHYKTAALVIALLADPNRHAWVDLP